MRHLSKDFLDDPFPTYRALRSLEPVRHMPDGSYFLTRYADCAQVYHDHKRFSSDKKVEFKPKYGDSPLYEHHTTSLVFNDPPYHTKVRRLLAPVFTPRALEALRPRVEELVDQLLDRFEERGEMDLIGDFASAIPIRLIGDILGVPEDEREPLRDWSLIILGALEPVLSQEQFETGCKAIEDFKDYLRRLIADRRRNPNPDDREILTKMIAAKEEDAAFTELELLHNCIFLLNAGHETTTNLIGNGIDLLLRHPDAFAALRADPELIKSAVEEFLRMESSNQLGNRRVVEEAEVGGVAMPPGTLVTLCIGAANRDPAEFPDPDRLDLRRTPNRHLAFGSGIHACAGMSLARMEGQVAIGKMVARFPQLKRSGDFVRGGRARFRGFYSYPVAAG
ncbi:MAG: cytochrome P450 [Alphaproteobacteria bacterium]|nr:cytochrome P450 [Alphaproteobacteria bacterium]